LALESPTEKELKKVQSRARAERGSGSLLMVGLMAVIVVMAAAAVCAAGYLVAGRQARSAADLAALSGAVAIEQGGDGCAAARSNASRNRARAVACERVGDQIDFVITVTAEVKVTAPMRGLPTRVRAVAYAGPAGSGR
jgi:secretion/DNA translocation related TadE-like protein